MNRILVKSRAKKLAIFNLALIVALVAALLLSQQVVAAAPVGKAAPKFDLPASNPSQQLVRNFMNEGNFHQALSQWEVAFAGTSFGQSSSGQALYSFLLFKNGLPNLALQKLFSIPNASRISDDVQKLWRETAPPLHPVWKTAQITWTAGTMAIFKEIYNSQSLPFPVYSVANAKDLKTFRRQVINNRGDSEQISWHVSQAALWDGIYDKNSSSVAAFDKLSDAQQTSVDMSRVWLNRARVLYQQNQLEEAIQSYNQVSKGSDYWIEALEEKAWAYLRLNQPDKTLAQLKTLFIPLFSTQVGPEVYFLAALTNLKICDYKSIFANIELFKKNFKDRIDSIQKLAREGSTPASQQAVEKLARGPYRLQTVAKELGALPRLFNRDQFIRGNIEQYGAYRKEAAVATQLANQGVFGGGNDLTMVAQAQAEKARIDVFKRLKYLAEAEVAETKQMIQKLHIVEAEVIQRLHTSPNLTNKRKERGGKFARTSDVMVFPVTKETWLDEADSFHVRIKDCPAIGVQKTGGKEI